MKGQVTPTLSDKIATWETIAPETPHSTSNNSDFALSGTSSSPALTAIDASTQTYLDFSKGSLPPRCPAGKDPSFHLSKEITDILGRGDDSDIEHLVGQLANLAIATRHLVDESSLPGSSTRDLHSSTPTDREESNFIFLEQFQQKGAINLTQSSQKPAEIVYAKNKALPDNKVSFFYYFELKNS